MAIPVGLLEWDIVAGTKSVTPIYAAGSSDAATNANYHVYRWNSLDTVDIGGTEWQAAAFWDEDEHLVIAVRSKSGASWGAWTNYVYDGVAETPEILRTEIDNHNNANIGFDSDGYLHIAYDHHNDALNYRRTSTAISSFSGTLTSALSMTGTEGAVSYPTFFRDPLGTLYFIHRDGDSGVGDLYFYKYTTSGQTWAAAAGTSTNGLLIDGKNSSPDQSPYWHGPPQFTADWDGAGTGYMWLGWAWRESSIATTMHDISVVRWDGTTFTKTTGSQTVPITLANCEIANAVAVSSSLPSFNTMVVDSSGNPHLIQTYTSSGVNRIFRTYHNGSSWATTAISDALAGVSFGANGVTAAISSNDTIYVVCTHPTGIGDGQYVWISDGSTWTNPWRFEALTRQDVTDPEGTGTDVGSAFDRYQWTENGVFHSLVPLTDSTPETLDSGDWPHYIEATITNPDSNIPHSFFVIDGATLTSHFWANVKSDLGDVRLTDGIGMRLPVLVHNYDHGAETATIFGAFPHVLASAGTHKVRIYYGNASGATESASALFGANNCFPSALLGFYPDGGGNDVTGNNYDLTVTGGATEGAAAGPFGSLKATTYNGTNQAFVVTGLGLPGTPTSWAAIAWAKSTSATANQTPVSLSNNGTNYFNIAWRGDLASPITDPVEVRAGPATSRAAFSATPYSINTWHHAAGLQPSSTSRYLVLDGTAGAQNTDSKAPANPQAISTGCLRQGSNSAWFAGDVSMAQIYLNGGPTIDAAIWQFEQANQATFWGSWAAPSAGNRRRRAIICGAR